MKTNQRDSGMILGACILLAGLVIGICLVRGNSESHRISGKGSTGRRFATNRQVAANLPAHTLSVQRSHPADKNPGGSSHPSMEIGGVVTFIANVSAYCPCSLCCGKWADGITASGYVIQPGDKFVAAPPEYPFGTMLDIPGYGLVPVLDRGGAIEGKKIETYHDTHEAALQWGRKELTVTIQGD